jgi:hypothetical protein
MIRFECPKCQAANRVADDQAGQMIACSECNRKVRVPGEAAVEELEEVSETRVKSKAVDEEDRPRKKKKRKDADGLGKRRKTFEPNKGYLILGLVGSGILCIVGVMGCLLSLVGIADGAGVALGVLLTPMGICGVLWCVNFLSLKVQLYEYGIVHLHNGRKRVIPWEEILSVKQAITEIYHNGSYSGTNYHYTLELEDGTRLVYTNYRLQNVEKLGEAIIEKTSDLLLQQAREDYQRGKLVEFGPLGVSEDGLHSGNSLLDWRDITGVKIKEGYISVSKRGKWFNWCNVAASSIPNLSVFLELVNEIVRIDAG